MSNRDALTRLRYRYVPDHVIGELLAKRWMDNAIPFLALIVVLIVFGRILPDFYSLSNLTDLSRQFAETGLVVLGLTIVMLSGGIDLSVGSVFGLAVLTASICMNVWELGVGLTSSPASRSASSAAPSTACWSAICGCGPFSPRW